jgi:GAF domain-containing protein/HAMP domain-containing protein
MSQSVVTLHKTDDAPRRRVSITRGIGRSLLFSFLILTLLPLILVGIISGLQSRASIAATTQTQLQSAAELRLQTVIDWLDERKQDIRSLRSDKLTESWLRTTLQAAESSDRSSSDTATINALLTSRLQQEVAQGGGFTRLFLLDNKGIAIASTDPNLLKTAHSTQPYANATDPNIFATLYTDVRQGAREIALAQGLFNNTGQRIGTLVGTTDLVRLSKIMETGTRLGNTVESYLVNDQYQLMTATRNPASGNSVTTTGVDWVLKTGANVQGIYKNYLDNDVYGIYLPVRELPGVVLATEQETAEALAPVDLQTRGILLAIGSAIVIAIIGAYVLTRRIVQPIDNLTAVAEKVTAGDLNQVAQIERHDQIGTLADSFNTMTGRLRDVIDSLETRVEMRTAQVQASADVGRAVTSILDPDQLLRQVVQLVTERFGFYYAAAFTSDPGSSWAVLREASGPGNAAWLLKQAGHRLELQGNSMVAACIRERRARIALDTGSEAVRFANPLLPDTHSEVALPLIVGDKVLGALDVQSTQIGAFDETSTAVLQNMADQIAVALNNAAQYRLEQNRAQQTTGLLEATVELTTQNELSSLYTRIAELAATLLNADSCALWRPSGETELELVAAAGIMQVMIGQRLAVGEGLAGRVYATGLALRLDETRTWKDAVLDFGDAPAHGALATPMIWQGQSSGVLVAIHTVPEKTFTADDGNTAQLFAAQAASAIANAQLLDRLQQTLTELGLANRRLTGEAWQRRLRGGEIVYQHQRGEWNASAAAGLSLAVPIDLRGQPIGQVVVEDDQPLRELSVEERQLVQEVIERMALALESARLFEQTQSALGEARRLAQRERLINRITSQLRGAATVDEVLRIATDEMRSSVGAAYTAVKLTPPDKTGNGQGEDHDSD